MDRLDLDEELRRKMEVLGLCVHGILKHHECSPGLAWAFEEADTLVSELRERHWENTTPGNED
ncbi:hypothetical protein [Fodinibius sp. Rm-B-1B1-1]|uniref:hypothetical protein n=1 Tax=Fodinibius alkaliphilus TaxID=3140241 RepID=UPI00315AEB27